MFHAGLYRLKSRHPLARFAAMVLALIAVIALIAIGVFVIAVLALGGAVFALMRALRSARAPSARRADTSAGVIEGEFSVVSDVNGRVTHS